jgi:hypothetical protein
MMEQRYMDALLFSAIILSVFGLATLWEMVKNHARSNRKM